MRIIQLIFISLFIFLISCEEEDDFFGPQVITANEGFRIVDSLSVSSSTADFTVDTSVFTSRFSDEVSWELTIVGTQSTARKEFSGVDSVLSVRWLGDSDNIFLFREGEEVDVNLTLLGASTGDQVSLTITDPKILEGILVADYEGSGVTPAGWWTAFNPGEQINATDRFSEILVPQGVNCLHLEGEDVGPDGFLGQSGHPGIFDYSVFDLPQDNDSLYFNFYVQGTIGSRVEVRITQSVDGRLDGDQYSFFSNIDNTNWRLISVPYSEFNRTSGDGSSPVISGSAITRVRFVLRTVRNGSRAEINVDYPVFTIGKPFMP